MSVIDEPERASRLTETSVARVCTGAVAARACLGTHTARRTRVSRCGASWKVEEGLPRRKQTVKCLSMEVQSLTTSRATCYDVHFQPRKEPRRDLHFGAHPRSRITMMGLPFKMPSSKEADEDKRRKVSGSAAPRQIPRVQGPSSRTQTQTLT